MRDEDDIIREILKGGFEGTQQELCQTLQHRGLNVTQATISRRLKSLGAYRKGKTWQLEELSVLNVSFLPNDEYTVLPSKAHASDAGFDLYASRPVRLYPLQIVKVPLGFKMEMTPGYEAQIRPRSSYGANGIIIPNAPGTIDAGYRGELAVLLCSLTKVYDIAQGERVAQMVFAPVTPANITVVTELEDSDRGEGGFGSTGK